MPVNVKLLRPEDATVLLSSKPLGDPAVGPGLIEPDLAADQSFGGKGITVALTGRLSVRAFNSADDEDEDGVLGEASSDAAVRALQPQLRLTDADAFLKYRGQAGVKATAAGTTLRNLGFEIEGSADVVLADYQRQSRTIETRAAVIQGLTALRSSLSLPDVLNALQPNEAVLQQVAGRLSAAAEVSWADVFSGPIAPIVRLAGTAAPLVLKVDAGASLKARISLTDDFLLVFSRESADRWRVGVRKARTRDAAIGLDLAIEVAFDEDQVQAVLATVIDGLLGERLARVEQVLSGTALDTLPAAQQALARTLIERLGLTATPTLDQLRTRVASIKGGIEQAITEVATSKLRVAFAYEYRRVQQDTTIAQCLLTRAGLTKHHPELVRGNLAPMLLDAASGTDSVSLEQYLNEQTIRSERSWGFSLAIGKWHGGGRDTRTITRVERTSAAGFRQQSFLGARAYSETGEPKPKWSVDFAADMPAYSSSRSGPLMSEFQYGLSLAWFEDVKSLKPDTLNEWLDVAVLWGACAEGDLSRLRETLAETLKQKCSMVTQLTFPSEAFSLMRTRIAAADPKDLAPGLGAAMPWMKLAGRDSVALRRTLYGPLWDMYLSDPDHAHKSGRDFSQAARAHLVRHGFEQLGNLERLYQVTPANASDTTTFGGSIDLNPSTIQNCQDFLNGVKTLQAGVLSASPAAPTIGHVFGEMQALFRQHLHVRALGTYLLDIARITGTAKLAGRSCSLSAGGQVYVLAS